MIISYPNCKDCEYSTKNYRGGDLACKRNPPMPFGIPEPSIVPGQVNMKIIGIFPPVQGDDWCGNFEKKEEKETLQR